MADSSPGGSRLSTPSSDAFEAEEEHDAIAVEAPMPIESNLPISFALKRDSVRSKPSNNQQPGNTLSLKSQVIKRKRRRESLRRGEAQQAPTSREVYGPHDALDLLYKAATDTYLPYQLEEGEIEDGPQRLHARYRR